LQSKPITEKNTKEVVSIAGMAAMKDPMDGRYCPNGSSTQDQMITFSLFI
jgi:hypothetical protein